MSMKPRCPKCKSFAVKCIAELDEGGKAEYLCANCGEYFVARK